MPVEKTTFRQLFQNKIQFIIPFFQRGYAWDKDQWKQLFEDIENEILNDLTHNNNDLSNLEHFFSSIVVMSRNNQSLDGIQKFDVLDGQQRLTTVYIIIGKIKKILEQRIDIQQAMLFAKNLQIYIENNLNFGEEDDYKRLKIFSSKGDRLSTYKIIFSSEPNSPFVALDNQFINYESHVVKFERWLDGRYKLAEKSTDDLIILANIFLDCLKIVWIPLDNDTNNAQAIFESLNARGTPLEASELLCNYIFRGFEHKNHQEKEELHNKYWLSTKNQVQDFDNYLKYLYSVGQSRIIGTGRKIYTFFKKNNSIINEEQSIIHLENIKKMAKFYNLIKFPERTNFDNDIKAILYNFNTTDIDSAIPFLMEILVEFNENKITKDETLLVLKEIMIMLIRIKVTGHDTKEIGSFFPSLYTKIKDGDSLNLNKLHEVMKKFDYLIDDDSFCNALIERGLYTTTNTSFLRMLLIEIDRSQSVFGQFPDYTTLNTIEHILPQKSLTRDNDGWAKYLEEDSHREDLTKYIHSLGNLLLLSTPANSHASDNPFEEKIKTYHRVTFLNRDVIERYNKGITWNIEAIKERSKDLAKIALDIWKWN